MTSPLPPPQVKRHNYLWNSVLWGADHRVCGCSVYTSLPCSVQSYRSSKRKKKSISMDNFSTVRLKNFCLKFHVLNQGNRQIFLYKCLTKLSKGHSHSCVCVYIYIWHFFHFILAVPHGMWNLSPLTKDRTCTPALLVQS